MMSKLPPSWAISNIGECFFEVRNGTTIRQNKDGKGIPVSRIETIQKFKFDGQRIGYIADIIPQQIENFRYLVGDLAFSHINSYEHVGKTALYEGEPEIFIHGMNLLRLRLKHSYICPKYVHLLMQTDFFRQEVRNRVSHAVNQVSINQSNLSKVPIIIAPTNEQRRIVAKLEKLLAKIDAGKERLDKIPGILKRFRQSVLSAACSGRLTADWRENNPDVEPAEELLKRIQEEKIQSRQIKVGEGIPEPFNLPKQWKWVRLFDICRAITDGDHQPPPQSKQGVPFLTISNITTGKLDFNETRFVPEDYYEAINEIRKPYKGDILYTAVGATYGIPVLVDTEKRFCFQRHIAILKPSCLISTKYLLYVLKSNFVYKQATDAITGTAQPTVPLSGLRQIKVALPPLPEQQEIVNRVQTLFKTADRIEQRYQKAKSYIDQLTQSILAKAFRGELVPQDPNDEPASVLLERIRAERENRENVAKTAKKPATNKKQRSKKAQPQLEPTPQLEPIQLELPLFD